MRKPLIFACLLLLVFLVPLGKAELTAWFTITAETDDAAKVYDGATTFFYTDFEVRVGKISVNEYQDNGLRFNHVWFDSNNISSVSSVWLRFKGAGTNIVLTFGRVQGELSLNAATFSTLADFDARTRTNSYADWGSASTTAYKEYDFIHANITTVFKEVINQEGFVAGSSIALFFKYLNGTGCNRYLDYGSLYKGYPQLFVVFTPSTGTAENNLAVGLVLGLIIALPITLILILSKKH